MFSRCLRKDKFGLGAFGTSTLHIFLGVLLGLSFNGLMVELRPVGQPFNQKLEHLNVNGSGTMIKYERISSFAQITTWYLIQREHDVVLIKHTGNIIGVI